MVHIDFIIIKFAYATFWFLVVLCLFALFYFFLFACFILRAATVHYALTTLLFFFVQMQEQISQHPLTKQCLELTLLPAPSYWT